MSDIFNLNGKILENFNVKYSDDMLFDDFLNKNNVLSEKFLKICDVLIDDELDHNHIKKRKTEIIFKPTIDIDIWNKKIDWVYIITFNGHVVKIGSTGDGLKGRTTSYLCGTRWAREKGTCSTTNFIIYNSILEFLLKGVKVEMYGYMIPGVDYKIEDELFMGESVKVYLNKSYEKKIMELYVNSHGKKPCLSNNK